MGYSKYKNVLFNFYYYYKLSGINYHFGLLYILIFFSFNFISLILFFLNIFFTNRESYYSLNQFSPKFDKEEYMRWQKNDFC